MDQVLEGEDLQAAVGISSTAIRNAVHEKDWTSLERLCTPNVAAWIKEHTPYTEEDLAKVED